ncbi:MAG: hypothetical protein HZA88_20035 [Verrucomicrobia bacterium]|nr:hypothetical protein [Verrucomicrobiota bacterium]
MARADRQLGELVKPGTGWDVLERLMHWETEDRTVAMNIETAVKTRMTLGVWLLITLAMPLQADEKVFVIPDEGWRVVVDAPFMDRVEETRRGADFTFKGHGGLFNLSLFVERPQSDTGGHKECYEFYWSHGRRNPLIDQSSVRVSSDPRYCRVEYLTVVPFKGKEFKQKHAHYYFVFNRRWMDLHISIFEPKPADEEIFRRFDRGLRYESVAAGRPLAGNKVERMYPIPKGGTLVLAVPAAWKGRVVPSRDTMPGMMTVEFTRDNVNGFRVLLSLMPSSKLPNGQKPEMPWLRNIIEQNRRGAEASAEEKELVVREFKEGEVFGCYYTATDRTVPVDNPPPNQARFMLQAAVVISGRVAMLTALSNTSGHVDQNAALEMIKSALCR